MATPGRLIDLLKRRAVNIDDAWMTVLDEADEMLNMGFVKDVRYILDKLPSDKQLCMFSATLSREVMDISWMYQKIRWRLLSVPWRTASRRSHSTVLNPDCLSALRRWFKFSNATGTKRRWSFATPSI